MRYVERLPDAPSDDRRLPDLSFGFYDHMIVFDNVTKAIDVVVLADVGDGSPAAVDAAHVAACGRIDATIARLNWELAALRTSEAAAQREAAHRLAEARAQAELADSLDRQCRSLASDSGRLALQKAKLENDVWQARAPKLC